MGCHKNTNIVLGKNPTDKTLYDDRLVLMVPLSKRKCNCCIYLLQMPEFFCIIDGSSVKWFPFVKNRLRAQGV